MTDRKLSRRTVTAAIAAAPFAWASFAPRSNARAADPTPTPTVTVGGSWTNEFSGVELVWDAPWAWRTAFGGDPIENKAPILYNTENDDFVMFSTTDPFQDFPNAKAYLDKVESDYSTGFFVPFRDNPEQIEILRLRRRGVSFAVFMTYEVSGDRFFELYDFRYDEDLRLSNNSQLSAAGTSFAETYQSLQEQVTVGGEAPFTTIADDDILEEADRAG